MSTLGNVSYYLQQSIDCIDTLDERLISSKEELEAFKQQLSQFITKLKSKKINFGNVDSISFVDNKALASIMNQMIEYAELNFTTQLEIKGDDDLINTIATTVNLLGEELDDKIKKLQELNITLEVTTEKTEIKNQELRGIMKALDNSALIFITDINGNIVKVNDSFCEVSKYTEKELLGKNHRIFNSDFHPKKFWKEMRKKVKGGKSWRNEIKCLAKDDSPFWLDIAINPITNVKEEVTHYLSIGSLITKRKIQESKLIENEKAIRQSLSEKDILLQEVHHRVKNNLQMISSLMELQIKRAKNKEVSEQLTDSQKRIQAISLLHEKLYQSENISHINISEYTLSLISSFSSMYGEHKVASVEIKHKIQKNIFLDFSRSIPFGLVFNEIISNCYKHAFNGGLKGEILIMLNSKGKHTQLIIKDSGKGMDESININTVKSLGLKLISSLSTKLKATVSFKNKNGLEVCLNFEK